MYATRRRPLAFRAPPNTTEVPSRAEEKKTKGPDLFCPIQDAPPPCIVLNRDQEGRFRRGPLAFVIGLLSSRESAEHASEFLEQINTLLSEAKYAQVLQLVEEQIQRIGVPLPSHLSYWHLTFMPSPPQACLDMPPPACLDRVIDSLFEGEKDDPSPRAREEAIRPILRDVGWETRFRLGPLSFIIGPLSKREGVDKTEKHIAQIDDLLSKIKYAQALKLVGDHIQRMGLLIPPRLSSWYPTFPTSPRRARQSFSRVR